MTIGIFLAIGESFRDFESKGQLKRILNYNIKIYSQAFDKVYIFTYADEKYNLPKNCELISNRFCLHRYVYAFLIPIIHYRRVRECNVLRGLQLSGGIPAGVSKVLYRKKIAINYGYNYFEFAKIERKYFQAYLYRIMKKPILSLADKIIVPSKTIAKQLRNKYGNKIIYIPNGVDTKLFHQPKKIPNNKILQLVFIGRLEEQKNLFNLIKATKQLKIPYRLIFFGQGSQSDQLSALAKELKVPLEIKKPIDYHTVAKTLRSCDIFILPSSNEGSSKILLEALASGCAIVASNIPQISEIVTDNKNGVLSSQEPIALAEAINRLLDFHIRKKFGKKARTLANDRYEINKLLVQEVNLLKCLSL